MNLSGSEALIDALVERVADRLAEVLLEKLRHAPGIGAPEYATAKQNPLRSSKAFRNAYRSGAFPTFLRNRQRTALWSTVDSWMRNRPGAGKTPEEVTVDDELAQAASPKKRRSRKTS